MPRRSPSQVRLLQGQYESIHTTPAKARLTRTAAVCALIYFLHVFSEYVVMAPRLRLFELGFCREYYQQHDPSKLGPDGDVEESLCKLAPIQASVVSYRSWQLALNAIPSMPTALLILEHYL